MKNGILIIRDLSFFVYNKNAFIIFTFINATIQICYI